MGPHTLAIFDFDWTLFQSPCSPPGRLLDWWSSLESLTPPVVPPTPHAGWWINPVVREAWVASTDASTISVVITGRREKFCPRIMSLLEQRGIYPDYLYCFPQDKIGGIPAVVAYKLDAIEKILQENPTISRLIVFEDLIPQIEAFAELADQYGLKYSGQYVSKREDTGFPWHC